MDELPPEFDRAFTIDEFLQIRSSLPDSGQWAELDRGRVLLLPAPEVEEGDVVGNLSSRLSTEVRPDRPGSLPLFRKPLAVGPQTVRMPAMSWVGDGFAAMDADVLTDPPHWVVEVAGSVEVKRGIADRIADYLAWGVPLLWIVDPGSREVHRVTASGAVQATETVSASPVVEGLSIALAELFAEPASWSATRPPAEEASAKDGAAESRHADQQPDAAE